MSNIQVDWQLWLKTQTSLSGSPEPCLHSPMRSLLRVHQRSWSGQKIPDLSCSGKPPPCPCWATSTSPCVTWRTGTASCCPEKLLALTCPWAGYGPLLPLHLRAVPTHCHHPPAQVLRRVGSGLDEEHHLLGWVDVQRIISVISCLLLRMKDTSRD